MNGLVFSGGGIHFATHAGVMEELYSKDPAGLSSFQVIVGTSAGSIYGGLLAAGYTPKQVSLLSTILSQPPFGDTLFDADPGSFAAAFLKYDLNYVKGAVRGWNLLSLFEAFLHRETAQKLQQTLQSDSDFAPAKSLLVERYELNLKAERNAAYYAQQLNFGEIPKDLYVVSTNAYTGQNVVFTKVGTREEELKRENRLCFPTDYINPSSSIQTAVNLQAMKVSAQPDEPEHLHLRRFEHRVYWEFDRSLYGEQLPLSVAIRASMSIPGVFEPQWIQKTLEKGQTALDPFVDGGVTSNFAVSVAIHQALGNCQDVLGISLTNLGYRLPDPRATDNAISILMRSFDYSGDAILDLMREEADLDHKRFTIINAMSQLDIPLTGVSQLPRLIGEGKEIAQQYWTTATAFFASENIPEMFKNPGQMMIYLSDAATTGSQAFENLKQQGTSQLPAPTEADVSNLFGGLQKGGAWMWVSIVIMLALCGAVSLILAALRTLGGSGLWSLLWLLLLTGLAYWLLRQYALGVIRKNKTVQIR
ncbi:patatin-like phospholipase family protein [Deinococcus cellulosilyticus]|uniref:PNPLA domain-containing protein n=1 Tax=Deinococcus cellulosilyticus (strain DSM 18568 / NBRC 106333 / KACC 11606 / 5516J-15) TaxID=1223518 RepID=A0A511N6M9_DEIC1|nr:patatin-like phospholipase family protein [Deinococcus cellulosilyticus]GEM48520.1 hypothetical protein DC3_41550 [Deinococcus cellulosilyticus NBRC 106333 = KACC 11606]